MIDHAIYIYIYIYFREEKTFSSLSLSLSLVITEFIRKEREKERGDKYLLVRRVRRMIQVEIVEYQLDTFLSPPLELVRTVRPRWIRIRISRRRDHPCLRRVAVENHIAKRRCNKQKYDVKTLKSTIKLSLYPIIRPLF